MKTCAIICEYNPLHNGHKFLMDKVRELGYERIVCFMSGNFVQRAEPAVTDKYSRAACAIKSGADAVFELPPPYATANAQVFAYGGIRLVSALGITDLAFGVESENQSLILDAAELQSEESSEFKDKLKEKLSTGISYPAALSQTTSDILKEKYPDCENELAKPNNVLAISYLRAAALVGSRINPIMVCRKGLGYNDDVLIKGSFPSSTAIRKHIEQGGCTEALSSFIPKECFEEKIFSTIDKSFFNKLIIHTLRSSTPKALSELPDAGEGIENKLIKNACCMTDLTMILEATKSKRYTFSRLRRLCLQAMLGINSSLDLTQPLSRLLAVKRESLDIIKNLPKEFYIKVSELDEKANAFTEIERRADYLYSLLSGTDGNLFYSTKLNVI